MVISYYNIIFLFIQQLGKEFYNYFGLLSDFIMICCVYFVFILKVNFEFFEYIYFR